MAFWWRACLIWALVLVLGSAAGATESGEGKLEGTWEGYVILQPARFELDLTLRIESGPEGPVGYLTVPTQGIHRRLDVLTVKDSQVSFVYKDPTGDSSFWGSLAEDGNSLVGDFSEGGKTYLCRFVRGTARQTVAPSVLDLSADGTELKQAFDREKAHPRLLLILSPTCHDCKVSARVIQRHVLIPELPDLRVFVVWEPAQGHDGREAAVSSAALLNDDPRVKHFWSPARFAGTSFREQIGFEGAAAWDVFLLFPPGTGWGAELPKALLTMNNRSHEPQRQLDTQALVEKVKALGTGAAPVK